LLQALCESKQYHPNISHHHLVHPASTTTAAAADDDDDDSRTSRTSAGIKRSSTENYEPSSSSLHQHQQLSSTQVKRAKLSVKDDVM